MIQLVEKERIEGAIKWASEVIRRYRMSLFDVPPHPLPVESILDPRNLSPRNVIYIYMHPEALYYIKDRRAGVAIGWVYRKQPILKPTAATCDYAACMPFVKYMPQHPLPLTDENIFASLCYVDILNYIEPHHVKFAPEEMLIAVRGNGCELRCDLIRDGRLINEAEWDKFVREVRSIKAYERI